MPYETALAADLDDRTIERIATDVLAQATAFAIGDAFHGVEPTIGDKMEAEDWFFHAGEGFRTVCAWVGYDPEMVRERLLSRLPRRDR